jgi:hypothetical protein
MDRLNSLLLKRKTKAGPYIRDLIERDLSGDTAEISPSTDREILATLAAKILDPLEAERMRECLGGLRPQIDQRRTLQLMLRAYLLELNAGPPAYMIQGMATQPPVDPLVALFRRQLAPLPDKGGEPPPDQRPPSAERPSKKA